MRIKIGHGTNGYIFEEIEKVKACKNNLEDEEDENDEENDD